MSLLDVVFPHMHNAGLDEPMMKVYVCLVDV